ncbi:hypothetical protein GGR88_001351 [Sphingomonas jejuensis]|uniref:Uncharacterized protein n=1 Tax=Sphingomonas jejuensis TaxID=904715 RepID=A0ABX0XLY6_9SPHN|nr:hypothetical protein [Sphingomonas jejuensis]NJC33877.1 hypothetical protein [Sphingomonas jejuensis]
MKSIPRQQLQRVVDAGHPDTALVGVPVSLLREILSVLPVDTVGKVANEGLGG